MKTFIQYLNEISPQVAARAFGARTYRTYANPSEHGAKQAGKDFEHMRKRADAAGLKPDDITKDVERGIEREFDKTPDIRIKQTIGDRKGGKAFELLKRIKKHTSLQNEDTLDEISLQKAARAVGARLARTQANPSEYGVKQMSRNLDHVIKKAKPSGADITGEPVMGWSKKGYEDEMKKTPKIRIKTAIEQGKGGEDSKLAKRIRDYEKERFSEDTLDEISPQVAARAYGGRSMRTQVNPSEYGRQKTMDAYKRYTKRRKAANLIPDELWPDYKQGEANELLKTPDHRIDKLKSQDALILRTRKKLEQLKNK